MANRKRKEEPAESDFGTPEARRQAFHIVEQADPQDRSTRRVRVEVQDQIDWLLKRDHIPQVVADALHIWQKHAFMCRLQPSCIGSYGQAIIGGVSEMSDMRLAAQASRDNAIKGLSTQSPYAVAMVDAVAVDGKAAGRWMMEQLGGSPHEALIWLNRFGMWLARHYGLTR